MVLTPPTPNQKAPPIPKRFTREFQQEQKKINQPTVQENQSSNSTTIFDEQKQVFEYYEKIYGKEQGERYKDIYFLQKKLEQLKASNANFQQILETQKAIAGKQQDIARTASAGQTSKGPGIDTVITKNLVKKFIYNLAKQDKKFLSNHPQQQALVVLVVLHKFCMLTQHL